MAEFPVTTTTQTVNNPVHTRKVLGPSEEGLGSRDIGRAERTSKVRPLFLRPFLSLAISTDSYFGIRG